VDFDLPKDPLHPSHDFMTGRVGRLVKVDDHEVVAWMKRILR
jgi:hypothetical protein